MRAFASLPRIRLLATTLALLVPLEACYSWRVEALSPRLVSEQRRDMRLTLVDGKRQLLWDAIVVGDTITGYPYETRIQQVALPIEDINQVELRHVSPVKTTALALGMCTLAAAAAGVIAFSVWVVTWDGPFGGCCQ